MLGYDLRFFVPISVLLIFLGICVAKKEKVSNWYWLTFMFGLTYINCAIDKLFFPIFYDNPKDEYMLENYLKISLEFTKLERVQSIYNILVTMPLAFVLYLICKRGIKTTALLTFAITVSIEFVQLIVILSLKPGNIWFDTRDIVLNVIGGVLGIVILLILRMACVKMKGKGTAFVKYMIDTLGEEECL